MAASNKPVSPEAREELWKASYETMYDSLFEELMAGCLITWWSRIDTAAKLLVALTASSSAVAGFAVWKQPGFNTVWLVLSAVAAVLSICDTVLKIPDRIKGHAEDMRRFAKLRTDLETFRYGMRFDPEDFDFAAFRKEFEKYRGYYGENLQNGYHDIIRTRWLEDAIQRRVNVRLASQIEQ